MGGPRPQHGTKIMKLKSAIAALLLCGRAFAQDGGLRAIGEVGEELQVCSAYFAMISGCLATQSPELSKTYQDSAYRASLLGASSKQSLGVSTEAILAFSDQVFRDMMKSIHGNCGNIAILTNKYKDFCKRIIEHPDIRLHEWDRCIRSGRSSCGAP